jgi:hypothetical protein
MSWVERTLLVGCLFGMLASWRLWVTSRNFPLVPIARWYPTLPAPWDRVFFGVLLVSLVVAVRFYRPAVIFFIAGALFLSLADQNRFQPWFYLYVVMLFLTLFDPPPALAGCRLAVSAVYLWSGIQKLNQQFFDSVVPWFVEPARRWLSPDWIGPLEWLIASAAAVEIFIGIGVWYRPFRRMAMAAAVLVHAMALVLLGPLGHGYNLVVWPWNLTMPLLVILLFGAAKIPRPLADLKRSTAALVVVTLFALLPAASYVGLWDSALSFCLYSGNSAKMDLYVSPELVERLPATLRRFVGRTARGELVIDVMRWGLSETGAPPLGEPRNFRALARYVARFARTDQELRLLVVPRFGPLAEYRPRDLR